jgi:ABC-type nitrate/sulfonate/bicarbonate transport system, permease component
MKRTWPALATLVILTAVLELIGQKAWINPSLLPPPSMVLQNLIEQASDFKTAFTETMMNVLIGYILSIIAGTLIAFVFSLSDLLKRAILPFAIFFQTVPIIAIAPLLVIYFGFGAPTVIASSFFVSLFPIIAGTLLGLESADSSKLDLFKIYGASSWQVLIKLRLPSAASHIYGGLKVSAGLAIIGAIAGEFVGGGGLGAMIDAARTQQKVETVFACLLLLSLMGLMLMAVLGLCHQLINRFRPYFRT